jgi:hypothetical protein
MLLVSPIAWDHYFLLLLLPAALLATTLPSHGARWYAFCSCLAVLWLTPELYYRLAAFFRPAGAAASPWQTLTVLSVQTYALLGLFVLAAGCARDALAEPFHSPAGGRRGPLARERSHVLPLAS